MLRLCVARRSLSEISCAKRKQPAIPHGLLDQLLTGAEAKTAFAKDGLLDELKKAVAARALNAEIEHCLDEGEDAAEMAIAESQFSLRSVRSSLRFRATGYRPSTRSCSPSISGGFLA